MWLGVNMWLCCVMWSLTVRWCGWVLLWCHVVIDSALVWLGVNMVPCGHSQCAGVVGC